jgi:hypothetical protein
MPVVYRCKYCGFILYVFTHVGQDSYGVPTPSEIMSQYGGICPRCGHPLEPPRLHDIVIRLHGMEELKRTLTEAEKSGQVLRRALEKVHREIRLWEERRRVAKI